MAVLTHRPGRSADTGPTQGSRSGEVQRTPAQACRASGSVVSKAGCSSGSALGTKPAPTLKVATNDALYARMPDDMDVNAGPVFSQGVALADKGLEIYNALLDLASGSPSNSEALGYGSNEFVPWHVGVVM